MSVSVGEYFLSPRGRTSRAGYWLFVLIQIVIGGVTTIADLGLGWYDSQAEVGVLSSIASLLLVWPNITLTIKRFHDLNKSGWWIFYFIGFFFAGALPAIYVSYQYPDFMENGAYLMRFALFIPIIVIAIIQFVMLYVLPGTSGENDFGRDPLERE